MRGHDDRRGGEICHYDETNFAGVVLQLFERGGEGMLGCACMCTVEARLQQTVILTWQQLGHKNMGTFQAFG